MRIKEAVILLAGNSKRFYPFENKPFFTIAGDSIVGRIIKALKESGIKRIVGIVKDEENGRAFLRELEKKSMSGSYVVQKPNEGYGTAYALKFAKDQVNGPFLVAYGDHILSARIYEEVMEAYRGEKIITVKESEDLRRYGLVEIKDGMVERVVEKPNIDGKGFINIGIYAFPQDVFEELERVKKSPRGEFEITDILEGAKIVMTKEFWKDIAYPWDLLDCIPFLVEEKIKEGEPIKGEVIDSDISGPVYVEEGAKIYRSVVEGPAYIGREAKVGPFSHIRGGIMEEKSEIGIGTTLKMSILGEGSKAKHLNYIGDSVVGKHVNFGGGSIIANLRFDNGNVFVYTKNGKIDSGRRKLGAMIGDNVKLGANVVILPGRILGKGSWVYPNVVVRKNLEGYLSWKPSSDNSL